MKYYLIVYCLLWICNVYSEENMVTVVEPKLNPANARVQLQIAYVLKTGQLIVDMLKTHQQKYQQHAPKEDLNWFVEELLKRGKDILIQTVHYEPQQAITIVIGTNNFIEPLLQKVKIAYRYEDNKWQLSSQNVQMLNTHLVDNKITARKINSAQILELLNWWTIDTLDDGPERYHFSSINCETSYCVLDYAVICWDFFSLPMAQKCYFAPDITFLDEERSSGLSELFSENLFHCTIRNLNLYKKIEPRCGRGHNDNISFILEEQKGVIWGSEFSVGGFNGWVHDDIVMMNTQQVKELLINSFSVGKTGSMGWNIDSVPRLNKKSSWTYVIEKLLVFEQQDNEWNYLIVTVGDNNIQFFVESPQHQIWQFNQAKGKTCNFIIAEGNHDKTRMWLDDWVKIKKKKSQNDKLTDCLVLLGNN